MVRLFLKGLLLTVVLGGLSTAPALSATWFVKTDGVDVGGCGDSVANACASITFTYITRVQPFASPPDEIRVSPGTYNECVEAWGFPAGLDKPVRLVADDWVNFSDNSTTIIDGTTVCGPASGGPGPTVTLGGTDASIEGFTVRGGGSSGIFGQGSILITNNVVTGNTSAEGGGIYFFPATCYYGNTTATISNNLVDGNSAVAPAVGAVDAGNGGGIFVYARAEPASSSCVQGGSANVIIDGNMVSNNTIDNQNVDPISSLLFTSLGGGIFALTETLAPPSTATATVSITRNIVTGNTATNGSLSYGGGIWSSTVGGGMETIDITDNTVGPGNLSTQDGGGISAWVQTASTGVHRSNIHGNEVSNNDADGNGGGLDLFLFAGDLISGQTASLDAFNNTVSSNTAGVDGGGGLISSNVQRTSAGTSMSFRANTVTDNVSGIGAGGLFILPLANADPDSLGPPNCASTLATATGVDLTDNYIGSNLAQALDPGTNVIGGGMLIFPGTIGDGTLTVNIDRSTVVGNSIGDGFVGGIEIQSETLFDCDNVSVGSTVVNIDRSVVVGNDEVGIGGPPVGGNDLTVTVSDTFSFGHSGCPGESTVGCDYEGTIFTSVPPPGSLPDDPLLDPTSFVPDPCSPIFAVSAGYLDDPDVDGDNMITGVDVLGLAVAFSSRDNAPAGPPDPRFDVLTDLNRNGVIDGDDLAVMSAGFGAICTP